MKNKGVTTVSISCKCSELLDRIKEVYGSNKNTTILRALEDKYPDLAKDLK